MSFSKPPDCAAAAGSRTTSRWSCWRAGPDSPRPGASVAPMLEWYGPRVPSGGATMSLWGTGVFDGDDQADFAESLCNSLLKRIVAILSRPDTLRRRSPETIDLLLCRMDALAALVGHISSENQNLFDGQLFPCDLP